MEDLEAKASYTFCEIAGKLGWGNCYPVSSAVEWRAIGLSPLHFSRNQKEKDDPHVGTSLGPFTREGVRESDLEQNWLQSGTAKIRLFKPGDYYCDHS